MNRLTRWTLAASVFLTILCCTDLLFAQGRKDLERIRNQMVDEEIVAAGVKDERVIAAMRRTLRHEFVPRKHYEHAYLDMALPIGHSQTISPPFVVAYMTEALEPDPKDKVLEIGTGSGYQAAVLSPLVADVYTIEIVPALGRKAARVLKRLGYDNVHPRIGDGYQGWPEHAPFDKIIVTCSPESVPEALVQQLIEGGRMIIPVGERYRQSIYLMKKVDGKLVSEALLPTLFVPMTGRAEQRRETKPDPTNPTLYNGGFEEVFDDSPKLVGWHYQRQLHVISDEEAPLGENYVTLRNKEPGRGAHALQGFGLDGRKVHRLRVSLHVKGEEIRPGQDMRQLPMVIVSFYDENRAEVSHRRIGPWRGTFPWRKEAEQFKVPPKTREALLRFGLLGAVGEVSFDEIEVKAVKD